LASLISLPGGGGAPDPGARRMNGAYFTPVPRDRFCAYCNGERHAPSLAPDVQAIYCISLQEQPYRAGQAAAHFHALGLCRQVTFFRPKRGRNGNYAIWESHCLVAQDAVRKGYDRVIVLEDDVFFYRAWEKNVPRIRQALDAMPKSWWGLYLGHVPIQAYFVGRGLLRVRSGCTHAYLANRPLLSWLATTTPMGAEVPTWSLIGQSIDSAMSSLPELYALFPMLARQRFLGDYRVDTQVDERGRKRGFTDVDRWRYLFIFRGARFAEMAAIALSPLHRLTLEWWRRRIDRPPLEAAEANQRWI
jgi:hypothetical protein